jgi:hypothetical protein
MDWFQTMRFRSRKGDRRLLRDVGLTPEQAFGPSRVFWDELRETKERWRQ